MCSGIDIMMTTSRDGTDSEKLSKNLQVTEAVWCGYGQQTIQVL